MSSQRSTAEDAPIPQSVIAAVAARRSVDESALGEALGAIYKDLVDGADAIHRHYRSEDNPSSIVVADGLVEVIFVAPSLWERTPTDLEDGVRAAAKTAHAEFARMLGTSEELLTTRDALVMPSMEMGQLVRAGLSRRQAEVQILRDTGLTQEEIGDSLGMATNTVKVHCHRIDSKVADAKHLVEYVDG